jgi:predicted SnoaL-like aldol condensation-catalyzing enzyme
MSKKDAAVSFLQMIGAGRIREAFEKYTLPGFRHHNAYFKGDAESLMKGMEDNARENPGKRLDILRALEDGDLVAVHSRIVHGPDDRGFGLVHIFRFEGDRVVEAWDLAQPVPAEAINEHGMF